MLTSVQPMAIKVRLSYSGFILTIIQSFLVLLQILPHSGSQFSSVQLLSLVQLFATP